MAEEYNSIGFIFQIKPYITLPSIRDQDNFNEIVFTDNVRIQTITSLTCWRVQ